MKAVAQMASKLKESTFWLFLPAAVLAGMVGLAVAGYDPLTFDASAYIAQAATPTLKQTSAEEAGSGDGASGTPAGADVAKTSAAPAADVELADGTYTGYAPCGVGNGDGWKPYYVAVTITVKGGKVVSINTIAGSSKGNGAALNWDAAENQKYLNWAISGRGASAGVKSQLDAAIAAGKMPPGVDAVSGATYSSVAIYNAFADAVRQSAAKAGKKAKSKTQKASSSTSAGTAPATVTVNPGDANAVLADGLWVGYAPCGVGNDEDWSAYYVAVTVKVEGGKAVGITQVEGSSTGDEGMDPLNWDASENQVYLDWAMDGRTKSGVQYVGIPGQVEAALAVGNAPTSIDAVAGATYSSAAIFQAYYAALKKSAAAAGSSIREPDDGTGSGGSPSSSADDSDGNGAGGGSSDAGGSGESGESGESEGGSSDGLVDGTYTGSALCGKGNDDGWGAYYLTVSILVEGGKVVQILDVVPDAEGAIDPSYVYDKAENATYLNKAISGTPRKKGVKAQIQAKLDAGSSVTGIDAISGATISSKSILEAYANAVENAEKASR